MSVPPVVEPDQKTMPRPSPIRLPPYIADKRTSRVTGFKKAKMSVNTDKEIIPKSDDMRKLLSKYLRLNKNIGIFKKRMEIPTGIFVRWLMRIEIPLKPPGAISAGIKNKSSDSATTNEPSSTKKYFLKKTSIFTHLLKSLICKNANWSSNKVSHKFKNSVAVAF